MLQPDLSGQFHGKCWIVTFLSIFGEVLTYSCGYKFCSFTLAKATWVGCIALQAGRVEDMKAEMPYVLQDTPGGPCGEVGGVTDMKVRAVFGQDVHMLCFQNVVDPNLSLDRVLGCMWFGYGCI